MTKRNIYLFKSIYNESAQETIKQLLDYASESDEDINLIINSPGGIVTDAFAIIDVMDTIKAKVNTFTFGQASSAGIVIASNGAKRFVSKNTRTMVHQVSAGTYGKLNDMKERIDEIDKINNKLFAILAKNTTLTDKQWKDKALNKDNFYTSKEAVDIGLYNAVLSTDDIKTYKLSEKIIVSQNVDEITNQKDNKLSKVPLLKIGMFHSHKYGKIDITKDMLEAFIENFKNNVRGIDISIDLTHENDDGEKKAVGWIKELIIENNKLVGLTEFNKEGRELISTKAFKYASPEYDKNYIDEHGESHAFVLLGGTLTNRPVIKNDAIKLSENGGKIMELSEMLKVLRETHNIDVDGIKNEVEAKEAEAIKLKAQVLDLETNVGTLTEENKELKASSIKLEKEKIFNTLLEAGKVTPAMKDKIFDKFETSDEINEFYSDSPVIVDLKTKKGEGSTEEMELTAREEKLISENKVKREDVIKSKKVR